MMRVLIACLVLGMLGCSGTPEPSPPPEVPGGEEPGVAQDTGPGWAPGEEWRVSDEPTTIIGALNGTDDYQFVDIVDAARLPGGGIAIADVGTKSVRVFDANGVFKHTLGGPGFGPGEFQDPRSVLPLSGGGVLVWDGTLLRSTTFDTSGVVEAVETVDLATLSKVLDPPLFPSSLEPLPDGGFLVRLVEKSMIEKGSKGGVKTLPSGSFRNPSGALRVSGDYSAIDTLMFFGDVEQVTVDAPWGPWAITPPLPRRTWIAHGGTPRVFCIGDQEAPEITCIGEDGSRRAVKWEPGSGAVTDDEVAEWRQENVRAFSLKLSEADVQRTLDLVPIPEERPPHSEILMDPSGYLWVNVGPAEGRRAPASHYLVFDPEGVQIGAVNVPPVDVLEIGEDYLIGVYRDELEVEYLHVYGVTRGSVKGLKE